MRRLEITVPGRWYVALTIALGVVAMASGNNVLYLIESLVLAGLILSGVLSERVLSAVEIEWQRGKAVAGERLPDRFRVENKRGFAIFCIEIGEWKDGKFISRAYLPHLLPRRATVVGCDGVIPERGKYSWKGLAVATSFPFGFARKIRWIESPGERLVWPARTQQEPSRSIEESGRGVRLGGTEISDGEIRVYTTEDDSRMIVWTQSMKGLGPMVRVRRRAHAEPQVVLDLETSPGREFEERVKAAARSFYEIAQPSAQPSEDASLVVRSRQGIRKFRGRNAALDQLALVKAEAA